jgi:hypothetical protein
VNNETGELSSTQSDATSKDSVVDQQIPIYESQSAINTSGETISANTNTNAVRSSQDLAVDKQVTHPAMGNLEFVRLDWLVFGWALAGRGVEKPAEILILREGKVLAKTIANKSRPDIAKEYQLQETNCGFDIDLRILSRHIKLHSGDSLLFVISGEPATLLCSEPITLPEHFYFSKYK